MYDFRLKTNKELRQMIADSERRYLTAMFMLVASPCTDVGWLQQINGIRTLAEYRVTTATAILASR